MNSFEQAMDWMTELQTFGIKPGLDRMKWMLDRLGNPQNRLKFIHIAGTNGKGSTLQFISNVLIASGYHVGTFTSPAIDTFTSRIQVNGQSIPDSIFVELVDQIYPLAKELEQLEWGSPTEFEVTTLIAILYFATKRYPDFVVWETGLGGRYDSTNVVFPLVSVITNIGYDHMNILGTTKEEIAEEKAGIIKHGFPVITAETSQEALAVLKKVAHEKKSPFYQLGDHFTYQRATDFSREEEKFDFVGPFRELRELKISMLGEHQVKNAALAVMVLEVLRQYYAVYFEQEQLAEGLINTGWPGRFEIIHKDPYLILDGAHNIEGIKVLCATLKERFPNNKLRVLFSALQDKDVRSMIGRLAPICDEVMITRIEHTRAAEPSDMEMWFRDSNPNLTVTTIPEWRECVDVWSRTGDKESIYLATGSLYFISDIRKYLVIHDS